MTGLREESLVDAEEDIHHGVWEREIKRSAERAATVEGYADSSSRLLDDVKAYYRIMLDSSSASEEAENSPTVDLEDDSAEPPLYFQSGGNRYWMDPAPPFNPKPLHTAPSTNDAGLQIKIPARYMVMFQSRATKDHLTRTVALMEEVTHISHRKIRATDFTTYEHVGKGFAATLNNAALVAVSTITHNYASIFVNFFFSCAFTHWLNLLKRIR